MTDPAALAYDLREALRPLWRRLNAYTSLSPGKISILYHLEQDGPLAATDLAAAVRVSHQAIALAGKDLESLGLVDRAPDPADRRRTLLSLTDEGRARLAAERSSGQAWLRTAIREELDAAERATLAAALPLLRRLDSRDHP